MTTAAERRTRLPAVLAGLAVIVAFTAVDLHAEAGKTVIDLTILGAFIAALAGHRRDTAAVGLLATVVSGLSGIWNDDYDEPVFWARLAAVAFGAVLAVLTAEVRARDIAARRRLELLAAVADVADGRMDLHATVERITDLLVPGFADLAVVDALQAGELRRLAVRAAGPDAARVQEHVLHRSPTGGEAQRALEDGETRMIEPVTDDVLVAMAHDEQDLARLRSAGMASTVSVPLRSRGRVLGTLSLTYRTSSGRHHTPDSRRFAEVLSGRVALALDNAGLFSELESMEAQLTAALGALSDAVTVQGADGRLVYANDAAAVSMGYESAADLLRTPARRIIGRYDVFDENGRPVPLEEFPGRRVLLGEPAPSLVVRAVERATGEERWQQIKATPVLNADGEVRLAVNVIEDITDIKRAEFGQRLLVEAGAVLAASLDYEETLQQVADLAVPELADWCGVSLPEADGELRQVAVAHVDPAKVAFAWEYNRRFPVHVDDEDGAAEVLRSGVSQLVTEIPDQLLDSAIEDAEQRELIRSLGMRSVIIVPLADAGRPIGVLSLVSAESRRRFTPADLALAEELGRRAGTAVANARLYAERTHIARTLQTGLLPDAVPDIPGLALATLYRPAGEENWVGGDFYDAFPVREGWMVVVGDVAGRGPEAAALTAMARHTLRTAATVGTEPFRALAHLNDELIARPQTSLVTVACALVRRGPDGSAASASIVCAGHPPALLVRGGEVSALGRFGPMLGAFRGSAWEPVDVPLADGDLLVLYTDGVIDTHGRAGRFGEDRLWQTVADAVDAGDAVRRIDGALRAFEAGEQADDTAIVAIRCGTAPAIPGVIRHHLQLEGGTSAPRRGRRAVATWLAEELPADRLYDVQILVSELVTNAVRHAGADDRQAVGLEVTISGPTIRVAVTDPGPGFTPAASPMPRPEGGGAGLVLVDRMTSRWAVEPGPPTVVWFEMERPAASAAA